MADHLVLPPGRPLESRRARGNPLPPPVVRRFQHGADLAQRLDDIADGLPEEVREQEDDDARVVLKFRATTRLANGPFSRLNFTPLGEGDDWTYYVLSSRESRELLASVLSEYGALPDGDIRQLVWGHPKSWAEFLDHVDGIELYGAEDRADASLEDLVFEPTAVVDCLLWPAGSERVATERVNSLLTLVAERAEPLERVLAVDPRLDRTLVRIVVSRSLLTELLEHVDIERIRAPLQAVVTQGALTTTAVPSQLEAPGMTAIGVVDGVVNRANPLTGPYILASGEFPDGYVFSAADPHGTAVASVAAWGDLDRLVTTGTLGVPYPIVSARVLDVTAANTYGVAGLAHVTIEDAIRWLVAEHSVRVANVSINFQSPANAALRNELTVTIDELARELGVVIVVSAGNRLSAPADWLTGYPSYLADPEARIAAPGDAALAVTVGSHAARDVPGGRHAATKVSIAAVQQPSPFTRSGPVYGIGRAGMMKPDFTHHGGNWCWDHQMGSLDVVEPGTAAVVAIPPQAGRIVGSSTGTSYAAPAVAHEIARIADRYPDAGANLLRALTALSARPLSAAIGAINPAHVSGYGQPDASRVLESGPSRVFLTFEGIAPTNRVMVHRLPVPAEYADGTRDRTFRVALAFDPPVRRSRREYVAGTMSVDLVRGLSAQQIEEIYARQPTVAAAEQDPSIVRHPLPDDEHRPSLRPGATVIGSNTLIRREFLNGTWDPDHGEYFLIVTHNQSPWTSAQRSTYPEQTYALAVEIAEEGRSTLDLYAAVSLQLRGRVRIR